MRMYLTLTAVLALVCSANAQTVYNNFAQWSGGITNGWLYQAQVMPVPLADNILREYRFAMAERLEPSTVGFSVQTVAAGVPTGVILYSDTAVWPVTNGVIKFENINLVLNPGEDYAFVVDFLGYSGESVHYTDIDVVPGGGLWSDNGITWHSVPQLDQRLYAHFIVPEPSSVLVLGVGLAALAALRRSWA